MAIINFNSISGINTISVASSITVGTGVTITGTSITATQLNVGAGVTITGTSITATQLNVGAGGTVITTTANGSIGVGTANPLTKFHICLPSGSTIDGGITLDDANRNAVIYAPGSAGGTGGTQGIYYFRRGTPSSYTDQIVIGTSGTLQLAQANASVLNSSGRPILNQSGSILQVSWKDLGSGSFTATSTSSTYRATGFTNTITPSTTSSKILHIVTIGVQFICDGNLAIARGGTVASPSLMDSYRDVSTSAYVNDLPAFTFTWLDSPATTSAISYELYCRATGCSGLMFIGSSSDFDSSWTLMEVSA